VDLRSRCALSIRIARDDGYSLSVMVKWECEPFWVYERLKMMQWRPSRKYGRIEPLIIMKIVVQSLTQIHQTVHFSWYEHRFIPHYFKSQKRAADPIAKLAKKGIEKHLHRLCHCGVLI